MVNILRVFVLVAISMFVVSVIPMAADSSSAEAQDCGGGVTWELSGDTLIFKKTGPGDGRMNDYVTKSPWADKYGYKHVLIGDGVTHIGSNAFVDTIVLETIDSESKSNALPNTVKSIGARAFHNCKSLQNFEIPDSVKSIGMYAFAYCNSLTSVTIPKSITVIEDGVFYECRGITNVELPDTLISIGVAGFGYCTTLPQIVLPESLKVIEKSAFSGCYDMGSITFNKNLKFVDHKAFYLYNFYDKNGNLLDPTAANLAGKMFTGHPKEMREATPSIIDDGGDLQSDSPLYVCIAGITALAAVLMLAVVIRRP